METLEKDVGRLEVASEVVTEQVKELKADLEVEHGATQWLENQVAILHTNLDELRKTLDKLLAERELPDPAEEAIIEENDLEPLNLPETIIELPATPTTPRRRIIGII